MVYFYRTPEEWQTEIYLKLKIRVIKLIKEESNVSNVREQDIKNKIKELSKEEDCEILKEKLTDLAKSIDKYSIKKIAREKYYEFWEITGYTDRIRDYGEKLGKLSKEQYEHHKNEIEKLRIAGDKEEFKKLIHKIKGDVIE